MSLNTPTPEPEENASRFILSSPSPVSEHSMVNRSIFEPTSQQILELSREEPHQNLEIDFQDDISIDFRTPNPSPSMKRPAKRRRTSISDERNLSTHIESDAESGTITVEVPQLSRTPDSESTPKPEAYNITTRLRRQAALKSRSATTAQYQIPGKLTTTSIAPPKANRKATAAKVKKEDKKGVKGKGKEKAVPKIKDQGKGESKNKKKRTKQTEEVEDLDDDYDCPCGNECSTISFCEGRKKEIAGRDVGMSVMLSCKSTITILVGRALNQEPFFIHKDLLILHSEYFAGLFHQHIPSPPSTSTFIRKSTPLNHDMLSFENPMGYRSLGTKQRMKWGGRIGEMSGIKELDIEQEEKSEEDIEMASSDQYHATVSSEKTFPTPNSTSKKSHTSSHETIQSLEVIELPPIIIALPFSLFISYIYTGSISPTLLLAAGKLDCCTWEALYYLGHSLRSTGFMNYCMEELRELKIVRKGSWPTPTEAIGVWKMGFEGWSGIRLACRPVLNGDTRVGLGLSLRSTSNKSNMDATSDSSSGSASSQKSTKSSTNSKSTPLHRFTAACIAYNSPMSSDKANTANYRAWNRILKTESLLSMAVHGVDRKMFEGKEPWDDGFRGLWKVGEQDVSARWREMIEGRNSHGDNAVVGNGDGIEGVKKLLEGMALRGESGLNEDGDGSGSESDMVSGGKDDTEASDVEISEDEDEFEKGLDSYERLDGRYERYGGKRRKGGQR